MSLFKSITNIEVPENDILPKNLCKTCFTQLRNISLFIDKCRNSDEFLRKIYFEIKEEKRLDEADFHFDASCASDDSVPLQVNSETENKENKVCIPDSEKDGTGVQFTNLSNHKCSACGEDVRQGGLKNHYRLHAKCRPDDCRCQICDKTFYPRYKLTVHLRSHRKDKPYNCPDCSKKFAFAENLRRHALTHTGVKPFICEICENGFLSKRSLDEHMNIHTGRTPYICVYCGKSFKQRACHVAHIYRTHNSNTEQIPKHKRKYAEKRVHLNLECKICGKIFASRSGYANHQLIHNGIKRFLCNVCGRKFVSNPALQSHIVTHTSEKPFECKECGKSFKQKNSLNKHMSHHLTDRSLNCPHCERKYYSKNGLNNHILTHTADKDLVSQYCEEQFLKNNLTLSRTDKKQHECSLCKKSFSSLSHLKVHLRTHSGEKPYQCNICGKQLALPQTLKVHMRQHTGETPYVCSVCNKGYHDSSNLKRHFNRNHASENSRKGKVKRKDDESAIDN